MAGPTIMGRMAAMLCNNSSSKLAPPIRRQTVTILIMIRLAWNRRRAARAHRRAARRATNQIQTTNTTTINRINTNVCTSSSSIIWISRPQHHQRRRPLRKSTIKTTTTATPVNVSEIIMRRSRNLGLSSSSSLYLAFGTRSICCISDGFLPNRLLFLHHPSSSSNQNLLSCSRPSLDGGAGKRKRKSRSQPLKISILVRLSSILAARFRRRFGSNLDIELDFGLGNEEAEGEVEDVAAGGAEAEVCM